MEEIIETLFFPKISTENVEGKVHVFHLGLVIFCMLIRIVHLLSLFWFKTCLSQSVA